MTYINLTSFAGNNTPFITDECFNWCKSALPEKCYQIGISNIIGICLIIMASALSDFKIISYSLIGVGIILLIFGDMIDKVVFG